MNECRGYQMAWTRLLKRRAGWVTFQLSKCSLRLSLLLLLLPSFFVHVSILPLFSLALLLLLPLSSLSSSPSLSLSPLSHLRIPRGFGRHRLILLTYPRPSTPVCPHLTAAGGRIPD